MRAKLYQPAKTAMQSGTAVTGHWVLEYAPSKSQAKDPLMGWTGAGSTLNQVKLTFETEAEARAFAARHGIAIDAPQPLNRRKPIVRPGGYGDNFATNRRVPWSH